MVPDLKKRGDLSQIRRFFFYPAFARSNPFGVTRVRFDLTTSKGYEQRLRAKAMVLKTPGYLSQIRRVLFYREGQKLSYDK